MNLVEKQWNTSADILQDPTVVYCGGVHNGQN